MDEGASMRAKMKLRRLVEGTDTRSGRLFDWVVMALIVYSIVTLTIETLPDLRADSRRFLWHSEIVVTLAFTCEYLLRLWVADRKTGYVLSFNGVIDLLAVLPFYLTMALGMAAVDLRAVRAFRLLRLAGYKIHGHWMPNLLGATMESDVADYGRLWSDPAIRPDELKIYPTMLLQNAELYEYWQRGEYKPYTEEQVTEVLVQCKAQTPRYVRLTRIIRDIPTTNVVEGFTKANLRQIAQREMKKRGLQCQCIRCREIRRQKVETGDLRLEIETYATDATTDHFLSFVTGDDRIAGFLRLSLPNAGVELPIPEPVSYTHLTLPTKRIV